MIVSSLPVDFNNEITGDKQSFHKVESVESQLRSNIGLALSATSSSLTTNKRQKDYHLIVHFDINETILIGDEAGGDTRQDCINKILAKSAFVQIPRSSVEEEERNCPTSSILYSKSTTNVRPKYWWDGTPIIPKDDTTNDINVDESAPAASPPPLYTGWIWPQNCCPYYRTALKDKASDFINNDGAIYQSIYNSVEDKLQSNELKKSDHDPSSVLFHIIPAFFETLMVLFPSEEQPHPTKKMITESSSHDDINSICSNTDCFATISIVLRTMGSDLSDIANAITLFAKGEHPNYPNYKNQQLIMTPDKLVIGRWNKRIGTTEACNIDNINAKEQYEWQLWDHPEGKDKNSGNHHNNCNIVASNEFEVLDFIHSNTICGIQDDYPFWKENNFQPWSGKPVWIERNKDHYYHHILFDDNM